MAQQADIAAIIAALGAQQSSNGTPAPAKQPSSHSPLPPNYQSAPSSSTPSNPTASGIQLPQPTTSGNVDLSSVKPSNSGSRDDPRLRNPTYGHSRSRSRSPPRRDSYRDNHNPYRDERRDDSRRATNGRDRSASPPRPTTQFSPTRAYNNRDRSPPPRSEDHSELITVDASTVGLIIGRSGDNLRRVEAETGARVQFMPDTGAPTRQCKISGNPRQRADAKSDILRVAAEHPRSHSTNAAPAYDTSASRGTGAWSTPQSGYQPPSHEADKSIQMMVPDRTVGLIIGRRGETIRDLQERSSCHVNIVGENKSINGYRPVNLIGPKEAQDIAQKLILEIVESDTRGAAASPGGPRSAPPTAASYGSKPMYDPYSQHDPTGGSSISENITVPSEAVGMIIGKGGDTIKDMQSTTGCKINVSPPEGPDIYRQIGLIGSRSAIEQAKSAILNKVETVREKQGGHFHRGPEVAPPAYDGYAHPQYSYPPPPQMGPPQSMPLPPPENDPYAPYGGYANYVAMWYGGAYGNAHQGAPPPGH